MPKMNDLQVLETSGVDHPAHLVEGFAVMKAKDPEKASRIMSALGKDMNMGTTRTPAPPAGQAALAKSIAAEVTKEVDGSLKAVLDELAKVWQSLQTAVQSTDEETPTAEQQPAAPAAPAAAATPVAAAAELEKALEGMDPAVRAAFQKQAADMADMRAVAKAAEDAAATAIAKAKAEEGKRLDNEAIAKSATTYSNLAIDHAAVAPALRALGEEHPLAKSITGLLTALNEQQDGADIFKELGHTGVQVTKGAEGVQKRAEELVATGQFENVAKAKAHIYQTDPAAVEAARTQEA